MFRLKRNFKIIASELGNESVKGKIGFQPLVLGKGKHMPCCTVGFKSAETVALAIK